MVRARCGHSTGGHHVRTAIYHFSGKRPELPPHKLGWNFLACISASSGEFGKSAGTLELVREKLDEIEERGQIIEDSVN